jgi:hypothetical protein
MDIAPNDSATLLLALGAFPSAWWLLRRCSARATIASVFLVVGIALVSIFAFGALAAFGWNDASAYFRYLLAIAFGGCFAALGLRIGRAEVAGSLFLRAIRVVLAWLLLLLSVLVLVIHVWALIRPRPENPDQRANFLFIVAAALVLASGWLVRRAGGARKPCTAEPNKALHAPVAGVGRR